MIEMKLPVTVRMLSVIRRYGQEMPFDDFVKQYPLLSPDEPERQTEVVTATYARDRDGNVSLTLPGETATRFLFREDDDGVTVSRTGEISGEMRFFPGKTAAFAMTTPFGKLPGTVFPLDVRKTLTPTGGYVAVVYLADVGGVLQHATVKVTVMP